MIATTLPQLFADFGPTPAATPTDPHAADWQKVVDRLLEFWNWTADWDGEGAAAPDRMALRGALALVQQFREATAAAPHGPQLGDRPPDRLLPGRDGTVILEWHFPGSGYAELEVTDATTANGMLVFADGRPTRFEQVVIAPARFMGDAA